PNAVAGRKNPENADRWIKAEWDNDSFITPEGRALYEVVLQIFAENDIMLLANITAAIADMKVSLLSINTKKRTESDIIINLTVGCKNIEHYNSILSRLRNINHIHSIERGYS
ncbi:MAG: bifunctional (p)ppGpp synthetase/guanosine-3',5'-bis(diphosphate) 3'-pyrophosphohydrolase, partial [Clostridia bacterium]|nr:bifunctional (p)ppGpp synthetase/guanosine-3',5'-bis(diphosphate) 3'-pyrophosphohydrolase [Clostridia bacterium]